MGLFRDRRRAETAGRDPATIEYPHFLRAALATIGNTARYVVSRRRRLSLEGRFHGAAYRNWSGDRRHESDVRHPTSVDEICDIVRTASAVRVVGSGHSFNDGLMSDGVTLSLDELAGVISIDRDDKTVDVWGGTRLRDLTRELLAEGLAFQTLASHDAQSIAGILSTDVHGTGREPAHFSDAALSLDLVDGTGELHEHLRPDDDLFRAAVGGVGAVGVITRVTLRVVDSFHLRQGTHVESRAWAEEHLDELFADHEHVSFYAYPFTSQLHVHTWTRSDEPKSRLGAFRESLNEAKAALAAATFGDASAHWGLLPKTATAALRLQRPTQLTLDSHEAFSRSQYHLHQELEIAVPRERVWSDLDELLEMYESRYERQRLPFLLVEIRFSPDGHEAPLLGAGTGRDSAWLCLCLNQSGAVGDYFADVEQWIRRNDARVHLGKWCEGLDADDLSRMHGDRFDRFRTIRRSADPDGRFSNPFVDRVLGPIDGRADAATGGEPS